MIYLTINELGCYEAKIEESEKGRQPPGVESRTPLSAAGVFHFPLFSPHNIQVHLFPA